MTKEEKVQLKKKLPAKWSAKIAESTGWSKSYVRRVMCGMASHVEIEREALILAQRYKEELEANDQLKTTIL
jgi:hypothetical protein